MALGIATSRRWRIGRLPRFVTTGLHKNASLLAVCFLALHVLLAVIDPDASVGLVATVVPFTSSAAPFWLGLGALALDLLLAILVTSLLQRRLSRRAWRRIHASSYAAWPIAWLHGLGEGTDRGTTWMVAIQITCLLTIAGAVWWRVAFIPVDLAPADPCSRPAAQVGGT